MSQTALAPSQMSPQCTSVTSEICEKAQHIDMDVYGKQNNPKQGEHPSHPCTADERTNTSILSPSSLRSSSDSPSRFLREFFVLSWIGKGAFDHVCAAFNLLDCQQYAIKIVPLAMADRSTPIAVQEAVTMASLPAHDNVVRYFGAWIEPLNGFLRSYLFNSSDIDDSVDSCSYSSATTSAAEPDHVMFIQMEYCGSMTLRDWMRNRNSIDTSGTISIASQLLHALEHIHKHGVVHRDVKPDNVFLHNGVVKLGNFRLSSYQSHQNCPFAGTASYAEPKQPNSVKSPNGSADVFSLGMCLFEMFSLFDTSMERAICFGRARKGVFEAAFEQRFHNLAFIVRQMLSINACDRPTCSRLLRDDVFFVSKPETAGQVQIRRLNEQLRVREKIIRSLQHSLALLYLAQTSRIEIVFGAISGYSFGSKCFIVVGYINPEARYRLRQNAADEGGTTTESCCAVQSTKNNYEMGSALLPDVCE